MKTALKSFALPLVAAAGLSALATEAEAYVYYPPVYVPPPVYIPPPVIYYPPPLLIPPPLVIVPPRPLVIPYYPYGF